MRVSLGFQVAVSGGSEIAEPTYWPVYLAVDDAALRFLSGDVVADWLVAPGALAKGELPSWSRDIADRGLAGGGYAGFGLLYSDGGADLDTTRAAYQDLIATLHTLVIGHAAGATGLDVLLGAFGGGAAFDGKPGQITLDRLRDGVDPQDLSKELDGDLVTGVAAFRAVGDSVLPFTQGVPAPAAVRTPGKTPVLTHAAAAVAAAPAVSVTAAVDARRAQRLDAGRVAVPVRPPIVLPPRPRFAAGTVIAVTAQTFRLADIAAKGQLAFQRPLPARVNLKTPLQLTGSASRGG